MAFKKMQDIEQSRYNKFLRLENDGDSIVGLFLYNSYDDVLLADVHYVKSRDYSGYVHCCGDGCPMCARGIQIRNKLFVPFLVLADLNSNFDQNTIVFWDRNIGFNHQLRKDVFNKYPNPTELVFKVTRHGAYRDINTTYSITPVSNFRSDVDEVLKDMDVVFPEYYENIVRSVDIVTLSDWMNENSHSSDTAYVPEQNYNYQATPRRRMPDPEDIDDIEYLPGTPVQDEEATLPEYRVEPDTDTTDISSEVSSDDDVDQDEFEEPIF